MENKKQLTDDINRCYRMRIGSVGQLSLFIEEIELQPTVDAVEVVRCEECLAGLEDGFICSGSGLMPAHQTFPNNFCNYGERKGGTDNA